MEFLIYIRHVSALRKHGDLVFHGRGTCPSCFRIGRRTITFRSHFCYHISVLPCFRYVCGDVGICCRASVASEQQHNQNLREICKVGRILEFISFYQNALHLTRVHCANFYQNALRHEHLK